MSEYFRRLRKNQGVPWAAFFSGMGALNGLSYSTKGVIVGTLIMSIFWIPVLLSNATESHER